MGLGNEIPQLSSTQSVEIVGKVHALIRLDRIYRKGPQRSQVTA
jgi:hypothetical protein